MTTAAMSPTGILTFGGVSDATGARRRMSRSMAASVLLHGILFLALLLTGNVGNEGGSLTEISWIEGEPGGSPAPAAAPAPAEPAASGSAPERAHFERRPDVGELEPDPQAPVLRDRLDERLASLQHRGSESSTAMPLAVAAPPGRLLAAGPGTGVGVGGTGLGGAPRSLQRGGGGTGAGTGTGSGPALQLRRVAETPVLPAAAIPTPKSAPSRAADPGEATGQRELAGATLLGPVANRKLLAHPAPVYPDWAKKEGVEASVRLYFVVRADGGVQENLVLEKTSGYEDFDTNALEALRKWKFEPLKNAVGEQWGQITFRFRLSDGS